MNHRPGAAQPPIRIPVAQLARPVARMARALLDDAATQGGGNRRSTGEVEELEGCAPASARRAAAALAELLAASAPPHAALTPPDGAAARESWLASLPTREAVTHAILARAGTPVAQRLSPARCADPALREALCRRLLAVLASPREAAALPAMRPGLRLLLDVPEAGLGAGRGCAGAAGAVAILPLAAVAVPARFAATLAQLRAAGWSTALRLPGRAALALLELERLPPLDLWVVEDPGDGLPELASAPPLVLAGRIGPELRARAAASGWLVEASA